MAKCGIDALYRLKKAARRGGYYLYERNGRIDVSPLLVKYWLAAWYCCNM